MEDGVKGTDSRDVSALVRLFEEAENATADARRKAERDRDYYDGKQWTDDEVAALDKRKQPVVTYNRIQRKVDFLSGLERQQRKDPKAFPRTPKDQDAANAATDAIRYVCDAEEWDEVRSAAWDNMLIEGTGAILVGVKQGKQGYDPSLTHIPWDRFFADPASVRPDWSDARYMGVVTWYDADVAEEKGWPTDVVEATISRDGSEDTYGDKPRDNWADYTRRRFRAIEIYHRKRGKWMRCVFTRGGYLEPEAPSPYLDEDGAPENPIKAASLYIDRVNDRAGLVRVMISPQDMVNKAHSKAMHLTNMRQVRVSPVASQEPDKIRRELAKPDGVVVGEKDDFEILHTNDMAAAQFNLLQLSMNEIDLLGANAALQGKNENDMSGRAIMAQQNGGMVEVARAFDRLRSMSIEVYRAIWNRVRQVWSDERWIRVTDSPRDLRFVGLNERVTVRQIAEEVAQGDPQGIQSATKLVGPQLMQAYMAGDQQAQVVLGQFVQQYGDQVAETRNAVNELDVDIVLDEGMDTPTVQAEQFDTLAKMLPSLFPQGAPPAAIKMLIEASALRDKDQLAKIMDEANAPNPMAEQQQQLQMAAAEAEVEKTKSETAKNIAQAQNAGGQPTDPAEHMLRAAEIETDQFNAVTDRMQAMQPERAST